ncbi:hypothetical protein ACXDF8_04760 [Mycolicibacterium sp. CBM1]
MRSGLGPEAEYWIAMGLLFGGAMLTAGLLVGAKQLPRSDRKGYPRW